MKIKNRHFFASALTGRGFLSYWNEIFVELKRLYLLNGSTPAGQSLLIRLLGLEMADRGCQVHYFHRPEDPLVLEGLTVPSMTFGVLTGDHPYASRKFFPSHLKVVAVELPNGSEELPTNRMNQSREQAVRLVQSAREIQDEICRGYRARVQVGEKDVAAKAAGWVQELNERRSYLRHYFAGSVAVGGAVEFLKHPPGICRKRYVIKGAPETGSVVMQEILIQALSCRFLVEAFHSWINPSDMVLLILPEIGVYVIDGTCCCDFLPLPGDAVWDLGEDDAAGMFRGEEKKRDEIKSLLAEAGQALDASREKLETGDLYLTEQEIQQIISRIIKETAEAQ